MFVVNFYQNEIIFRLPKLKSFDDNNNNKKNVTQKLKDCYWISRKHLRKGENAGHQHFLLTPPMF